MIKNDKEIRKKWERRCERKIEEVAIVQSQEIRVGDSWENKTRRGKA